MKEERGKENNRNVGNLARNVGNGRNMGNKGGGSFPMTVYQEAYQRHGAKVGNGGKKSGNTLSSSSSSSSLREVSYFIRMFYIHI